MVLFQGCQMVSFQTKNSNLGKFWRALPRWENCYIYDMAIWNILRTFLIFYNYLVHFVFLWYILSGFGIMYQGKSGNPVWFGWFGWRRKMRYSCEVSFGEGQLIKR
jgi:hypothetical protein